MRADYHVHTSYSNDSNYPIEDCIIKAISLGLDEICITEHCDHGPMGDYVVDYEAYYQGVQAMQKKYGDQITIKFGCEFGMQTHTIEYFEEDFKKYPFDFIILSNHQIDDLEFHTNDYQSGKTQTAYNEGYYQAIYDTICKYDNYSVLGHLDVIKRYDQSGIYPDEKVDVILTKILKHIIAHKKGIEINTSYLRYGLKDTTPSRYILKKYYDLGGKIITIGSDSHNENQLGYGLDEAKKVLKEIGFQSYCTFDAMQEIFHAL